MNDRTAKNFFADVDTRGSGKPSCFNNKEILNSALKKLCSTYGLTSPCGWRGSPIGHGGPAGHLKVAVRVGPNRPSRPGGGGGQGVVVAAPLAARWAQPRRLPGAAPHDGSGAAPHGWRTGAAGPGPPAHARARDSQPQRVRPQRART